MFSYILSKTKQEMYEQADACGDSIPHCYVANYVYEITVSFNPMIHNKATALASQKTIVDCLQKYLEGFHLEEIDLVIEYQKNGMAHYHIAVHTIDDVESSKRFDVVKAFQRQFGRSSFKPVIDWDAYRKYMIKDVKKNYLEKRFFHCYSYIC